MTNAQIILSERIELAEAGIIGYTDEEMTYTNENGEEITIKIPEEIHTYAAWKKLGYQVQKGEKALAKIQIWKHVDKKVDEDGNTEELAKIFLKTAHFFSAAQVAPVA